MNTNPVESLKEANASWSTTAGTATDMLYSGGLGFLMPSGKLMSGSKNSCLPVSAL